MVVFGFLDWFWLVIFIILMIVCGVLFFKLGKRSMAVLARLKAPTPEDSPICCDIAMAWFYHYGRGQMKEAASLAALAGLNWVRDRMSWGEIEPQRGEFAEDTRYDRSAEAQSGAGLRVLQVLHATPGWATDRELDGRSAGKRSAGRRLACGVWKRGLCAGRNAKE